MDTFEAIYGRRSIRAFSKKDITRTQLTKILDAGRQAPSAGNLQPWELVVVRDSKRKMALARAAFGQYFIAEAPIVVVICVNPARTVWRYGDRGAGLYCLQDTAAFIQNMLLASYAIGLGSCWVGAFDEARAAEAIEALDTIRPVAIVPIGSPAESPSAPARRSLGDIVHEERF
jgi:nitroreductase